MIRVVVFDFDGTLVDSNRVKKDCMRKVAESVPGGAEALPEALKGGGNRYRIFAAVARAAAPGAGDDAIRARSVKLAAAYTECCARAIAAVPERRGGRAALAALRRRGLRLWIASATPHRDLPPLLRRRGLDRYLDGALGGPASKADNLRHIMMVEGVRPQQMLMVGDGPDDAEGARILGIRFVAIDIERRIAGPQRHPMRDLTPLAPLVARLRSHRGALRR